MQEAAVLDPIEVTILFLIAVFAGTKCGKVPVRQLGELLGLVFIIWCIVWQMTNDYPGLLSGAFVDRIGVMVLTTLAGLVLGALRSLFEPRKLNY